MAKRKTKSKKRFDVRKCNGIFYKDVLWSFDEPADFLEAFEGFKLWIEVDANNVTR